MTEFDLYPSRRSPVYAMEGMVAASQPLAVAAGLKTFRQGGNAADAAVAELDEVIGTLAAGIAHEGLD